MRVLTLEVRRLSERLFLHRRVHRWHILLWCFETSFLSWLRHAGHGMVFDLLVSAVLGRTWRKRRWEVSLWRLLSEAATLLLQADARWILRVLEGRHHLRGLRLPGVREAWMMLIRILVFLIFKLQHAHILQYDVHITREGIDWPLVHLVPEIDLFACNHTLNWRLHQYLTLGHHLVVEDLVLFSIKGDEWNFIGVLSLIHNVVLGLLKVYTSSLEKADQLLHFGLIFPAGLIHLGQDFSLFLINLLPKLLKLAGNHVPDLLVALIYVSFTSL